MSRYIPEITQAVVDKLSTFAPSSSSGLEFTPERVYIPQRDYSEITDLKVIVFARAVERVPLTRNSVQKTPEVTVTVAKKIEDETNPTDPDQCEELDDLMELCDDIADYLTLGGPYAGWPIRRVEVDPIYDFEHLRTHRVFVTALRAFFFVAT